MIENFKIDPDQRLPIREAITIMKQFGQLLGFTEKFKSAGNISVNISQNTQQSIDMTNLENLTNLTRGSTNFSAGRTHFHDQKDSQLCHSFAVVSAVRQALLKFLKNLLTDEQFKIIGKEIAFTNGKYSFRLFLVNFVGNVNPRSYQGLVNLVNPNLSSIEKQTAVLKTVIERLVKRTTFEIEGWKRLLAIRQIFQEVNLEIDNHAIEMEEINSSKFEVRKLGQNSKFSLKNKNFG